MSRFRDHFSAHAREYARSRPGYPAELYDWLATLVEHPRMAWDCATGNGQAAIGLVGLFDRVLATDASVEQLANAPRLDGARFASALSARSPLPADAVDLVTVAQAMHWFDLEPFYREVERVLRPGGVLAAWTYALLRIESTVDAIVDRFAKEAVGPFWLPQRRHVEAGYSDLEFPFDEITAPGFVMRATWTLHELLAYIETWSSVRRFWSARGFNPVADLEPELGDAWGPAATPREVRWHLSLRVGRSG